MRPAEIETLAEFDARTAGRTSIRGWHLQSLDLRERAAVLARLDVARALFLGCTFGAEGPGSEDDVRRRGGLLFPTVPDVPFNPYRGSLYTADELYAGLDRGYARTPDATVYAWSQTRRTLDKRLAQALHDHAIDDALDEFVRRHARRRPLVGVMGGHAALRGEDVYHASVVLGRELSSRFTVVTGGGPGAMEAANLGAWLVGQDDATLAAAEELLAGVPTFAEDVGGWAQGAFEVRDRWPTREPHSSLGIPTWFYGHEPPNAFATSIAKYFRNALREDELLRICSGGIVFLPGAAGTVQEIFQDACGNFYALPEQVSPMVLVGREYWTNVFPAWPLLLALAEGRAFAPRLHLVDSAEEVLPLLVEVGGRGR
ncbi:MAG TPA: Rossmann fold nucleotide-binding protein [Marmoricola sp.]|nr:Rossmann fold nucleotide-binding protein [Marmoricola sp.]